MSFWIYNAQLVSCLQRRTQVAGQQFFQPLLNSNKLFPSFFSTSYIKWFRKKEKILKPKKKWRKKEPKSNAKKLIWMSKSFLQAVANMSWGSNNKISAEISINFFCFFCFLRQVADWTSKSAQINDYASQLSPQMRCVDKSQYNAIKVFHLQGLHTLGQEKNLVM